MSIASVIRVVARLWCLSLSSFTRQDRRHPLAEARQVAMFLAVKYVANKHAVAKRFRRQPDTVRQAIRSVHNRLDTDKKFHEKVRQAERILTMNLNWVMVAGRLTQKPLLWRTGNGAARTKFLLQNSDGIIFEVMAYDKQAEALARQTNKDDHLLIDGKLVDLVTRTGKVKRSELSIVLDSFQIL